MSGARIELDGRIEERGGQQFVSGRGLHSDGYTRIHRIEPAGFASVPVKGAQALALSPNGNADEAYVLGGESPGHRPQGLPSGATALYDHNGNIIKLVGSGIEIKGDVRFVGNITIEGNLHVTGNITCDGTNPNHHGH